MKKYKQFIAGLLVGSLLFSTSPSFAKALKYIKVKINGEYLQKNAIIIDGTTYVPLKVIGEKFGKKVNYDAKANEVEVSNLTIESNQTIGDNTQPVESKPQEKPEFKSNDTNLPQGAEYTWWEYGIKYNGQLYIFSNILEDKLYIKLTSDKENMYFKNKDGKIVSISYQEAENPDNKIKIGGTAHYFNVKYFKDFISSEYTQE